MHMVILVHVIYTSFVTTALHINTSTRYK